MRAIGHLKDSAESSVALRSFENPYVLQISEFCLIYATPLLLRLLTSNSSSADFELFWWEERMLSTAKRFLDSTNIFSNSSRMNALQPDSVLITISLTASLPSNVFVSLLVYTTNTPQCLTKVPRQMLLIYCLPTSAMRFDFGRHIASGQGCNNRHNRQ
jgi:hypothetical protein